MCVEIQQQRGIPLKKTKKKLKIRKSHHGFVMLKPVLLFLSHFNLIFEYYVNGLSFLFALKVNY